MMEGLRQWRKARFDQGFSKVGFSSSLRGRTAPEAISSLAAAGIASPPAAARNDSSCTVTHIPVLQVTFERPCALISGARR
jgi:hypothetical protein